MNNFIKIVGVSAFSLLSACASLNSTHLKDLGVEKIIGGLNYYMPKKDLVVTYTVESITKGAARDELAKLIASKTELDGKRRVEPDRSKRGIIVAAIKDIDKNISVQNKIINGQTTKLVVSKVEMSLGDAYPDLDEQYSLSYGANLIGDNSIDVKISESGLLSSADSKTVSKVTDVFTSLASTVAHSEVFGYNKVASLGDLCAKEGTYTFSYDFSELIVANGVDTICVVAFNLAANDLKPSTIKSNKPKKSTNGKKVNGVFYRQSMPYKVALSTSGFRKESMFFSPSGSKVHMLPVKRTLFSDNHSNFAFVDGVPTKYTQSSDGELVAFLKIPSEIAGAYFEAVGSVFDSFSKNDTAEAVALNSDVALLLAKQKAESCKDAIEEKDTALIETLKCGQSD